MVDEDIGCLATCQKWFLFVVNILLFILGCAQIGTASYILQAGSEDLEFASDVLDGNDTAIQTTLAIGVLMVVISFLGCVGAKKESRCLLWIYAVILFFMIVAQAMGLALVTVSLEYGDSIFESLWKKLDPATIADIEEAYECCSFNGNSTDTWTGDIEEYNTCSDANDFNPMVSCWEKFQGMIEDNYCTVKAVTAIFMVFQIVTYFSTHYLMQSIANAEGIEDAGNNVQMGGKPQV